MRLSFGQPVLLFKLSSALSDLLCAGWTHFRGFEDWARTIPEAVHSEAGLEVRPCAQELRSAIDYLWRASLHKKLEPLFLLLEV